MVLILNIVIFCIAQILIKLVASHLPRAQALSLMFLTCALIASGYGLITGNFIISSNIFIVGAVGFFVAFGAYCQWQAIKLNLSRTSLFNPLSDVLTILLVVVFLSEAAKWNLKLISGMILCFAAIFLFVKFSKKTEDKNESVKKWLFWTLGMIIIFGTATFLMKVFSSEFLIPRPQFLIYWYIGAFLGSVPLLFLEKQNSFKFPGKLIFLAPLAGLFVLGNLATTYWAFELTLASQVVPFRMVGITFLPILIGWFVFKERKSLSKKEILAFSIGAIGAILIILS